MTIPLLSYHRSSQNHRVVGYEISGYKNHLVDPVEVSSSTSEIEEIIWTAYRQIFNEQQLLVNNRQTALASQLKAGRITVKQFIRGLVLSETFPKFS